MNLSCPELALHLPADLLWLRHTAHELSHPCPPPSSSSQGRKNNNEKLSAANLLSVSFEMCGALAGAQWLSSAWLAPAPSLAQISRAGTPAPVLDPAGSPSRSPEQQHCLSWAQGVCCSHLTPLPKTVVTSQPRCFISKANGDSCIHLLSQLVKHLSAFHLEVS